MSPLYIKLAIGAALAALLGIGVSSWLARGARIDRLESTIETVQLAATQATVEPDKNGKRKLLTPGQVPAAIFALKSSYDSAANVLAGIDMAAQRDKQIQARLDAQLSAILDNQDATADGTKARITDLLTRQATGDREKDCIAMTSDSNAPWDGWSK